MGKGIRVSKNMLLRMAKTVVDADEAEVTSDELASSMGITPAAAKQLLSEMADAGDIDRYYPTVEGKRGRQAAVYRKMTEERAVQLEPVIRCREAVAVRLNKENLGSANVTLSKVTLSLADAARLLNIPVPDVDFDSDDEDEEASE